MYLEIYQIISSSKTFIECQQVDMATFMIVKMLLLLDLQIFWKWSK